MADRPVVPPPAGSPYQLFILVLCLWALGSLAVGAAVPLAPDTLTVLEYADTFVCAVFLVDFLVNLYRAPSRWGYLATWGWIDLLSSIPTVGVLRVGRAARIARILRVLRAVKSVRVLGAAFAAHRAQSAFLAVVLLTVLLLVFSALAVLQLEAGGAGNIRTAQDAMWWAVTTMTTVGYGDTYPTTPEGRLVAVFLMMAGIGVFGTFSGLVASWFLTPRAQETESELDDIRAALHDIQRRLPPLPSDPPQGG
ncbi:MAG: ion transporter [Vicinamibacterales bacterium]